MGRGPNATTSRTYCMARVELEAGGGPGSAAKVEESREMGTRSEATAAFGFSPGISRAFGWVQVTRIRHKITHPVSDLRQPHAVLAGLCSAGQPGAAVPTWVLLDFIASFVPAGPCAAWDAPATQWRCSLRKARPWARRKCTCSEYRW